MSEDGDIEPVASTREAFQCVAPPSIYIVLQGDDKRFYPAHIISAGDKTFTSMIFLDGRVISFEHFENAQSFCQDVSQLQMTPH